MTTNSDAFTMNVVHHHHDTVINNDAQINPAQSMIQMMLSLHMLKALSDGFRENPMLDSPTEPIKLIGESQTVEYEILSDETEESFQRIQPTCNPYYKGKKYYDIYRSVLSPRWKRVIRDMNVTTPLAIVILEIVDNVNETREFISLYNSAPTFTKAMYGKSAPKEQVIPRNWDHAPYFLETLCELENVSKSRGQKFAYYIEELDLTSKKRFDQILSNDFPKTEIYEHISIFSFKPDIVYTNFERNIFQIEFKEDSFVVRRN